MKAQHVVVLETVAQPGGAQISLIELIRKLDGVPRITVILPEDGPLKARLERAGATVRVVQWPRYVMRAGERGTSSLLSLARAVRALLFMPGLLARISGELRRTAADRVITNGIKAHLIGTLAAPRRIPVLWYLRDLLEGRRLSSRILAAISHRCAGAIAISRCVEEDARRYARLSAPITVVYNIVDFERFRPGLSTPEDFAPAKDEVWFGVVGALTPLKGHDLFLKAAAVVAASIPTARFAIIGTNFYRTEAGDAFEDELRRLAEVESLKGRVRFMGHREDMPALLNALNVLVQPNRGPEALGRSILEAMACRLPVIAVNRWGPAELIRDGETGLLTSTDVPSLAAAMLDLACDDGRRRRLAQAGYDWVLSNLSPSNLVAGFRSALGNTA
jgi:glycosyltransferase involved in cell wall biosynthesis